MLFYRRLSTTFTHAFKIATWVGIAFNVLYFVGWIIYVGAQCSPYYAYWRQFDPVWVRSHNYKCGSEHYSLPISAALSVMGDAYATVLPLVLVRGLDLPKRQKAALYALFGLGFLVVAAGIVRTVLLNYMINESYDATWYLWKVQVWTFVELYVAIMAASAPALKPLFKQFFLQPISTSRRNRRESWHANNGFPTWRRSENVQNDRALKRLGSNGFTVQDESWFENDIENNSSDGPRKYTLQALPDRKAYQLQVDADEVRPYVARTRPQKS